MNLDTPRTKIKDRVGRFSDPIPPIGNPAFILRRQDSFDPNKESFDRQLYASELEHIAQVLTQKGAIDSLCGNSSASLDAINKLLLTHYKILTPKQWEAFCSSEGVKQFLKKRLKDALIDNIEAATNLKVWTKLPLTVQNHILAEIEKESSIQYTPDYKNVDWFSASKTGWKKSYVSYETQIKCEPSLDFGIIAAREYLALAISAGRKEYPLLNYETKNLLSTYVKRLDDVARLIVQASELGQLQNEARIAFAVSSAESPKRIDRAAYVTTWIACLGLDRLKELVEEYPSERSLPFQSGETEFQTATPTLRFLQRMSRAKYLRTNDLPREYVKNLEKITSLLEASPSIGQLIPMSIVMQQFGGTSFQESCLKEITSFAQLKQAQKELERVDAKNLCGMKDAIEAKKKDFPEEVKKDSSSLNPGKDNTSNLNISSTSEVNWSFMLSCLATGVSVVVLLAGLAAAVTALGVLTGPTELTAIAKSGSQFLKMTPGVMGCVGTAITFFGAVMTGVSMRSLITNDNKSQQSLNQTKN